MHGRFPFIFSWKTLLSLGMWLLAGLVCLEMTTHLIRLMDWLEWLHLSERQKHVLENRFDSGIDLVEIDNKTASSKGMSRLFRGTLSSRDTYINRLRKDGADVILASRASFSPDAYAYLIRFFNRAGAKLLVLDIAFMTGKDTVSEQDQAFADAVRKSRIPVMSAFLPVLDPKRADSRRTLPPSIRQSVLVLSGKTNTIGYSANDTLVPVADSLRRTPMAFYAAEFIRFDFTGTVRQTNPFVAYGKNREWVFPTLPLAAALMGERHLEVLPDHRLKAGNRIFDFSGNPYPYIRWYGDLRGVRTSTREGIRHIQYKTRDALFSGPVSALLKRWLTLDQPNKATLESYQIYPRYSFSDIIGTELWLECRENPAAEVCKQLDPVQMSLQKPIDPKRFRGHYVLVGWTDLGSADTHQTLYGQTSYPGVYILANILDNYLHNDFVRKPELPWTLLTAAVFFIFTTVVCLRMPVVLGVLPLGLGGFYWWFTAWVYQEQNLWLNWTWPMLALVVAFSGSYLCRYVASERKKQKLRFAFAKYVSRAVMQAIEKNPDQIRLGGQRRELTMLFSDIRGFTTFSENHEPEVVQQFLTEYFSVMNGIILHDYGGSINKLIGDAIMAYWGFPLENEDHAYLAVCAALQMKAAMTDWNRQGDRPPVKIGIGINTGDAVIGNVGSQDFMDFTVIGDSVNTASRLESLNKEHGTTIIISEFTYGKIHDRVRARPLGEVAIRGKERPVKIYEPVDLLQPGVPPVLISTGKPSNR